MVQNLKALPTIQLSHHWRRCDSSRKWISVGQMINSLVPRKKGNSIPQKSEAGMTCTSWGFPKLFNNGYKYTIIKWRGHGLYIMIDFGSSGCFFMSIQKNQKHWSNMTSMHQNTTCRKSSLLNKHQVWSRVCMFFNDLLFFFRASLEELHHQAPRPYNLVHALGAESAGVSGRRGVTFFLTQRVWVAARCYLRKSYPKTKTKEIFYLVGKHWMFFFGVGIIVIIVWHVLVFCFVHVQVLSGPILLHHPDPFKAVDFLQHLTVREPSFQGLGWGRNIHWNIRLWYIDGISRRNTTLHQAILLKEFCYMIFLTTWGFHAWCV